ncbi:FG-GAP repeat domain-containing protein [Actinoplanes flavus]|uniref:VCBS repeat-containing protein n=1 Tax=Actinoplanes flavus TaxID=2820290 RepID=A0ABS3UVT3_9ACTN|nr:VCBS repeat-containing protein [Actinoplanes flavus]MBO3742684.1 VCBS repeat-containing protein [Actinoplanes flavus]
MTNLARRLLALTATVAVLTGVTAAPAYAWDTVACDPAGVTSRDTQLAQQLNPQLTGQMKNRLTGYKISCARMVVDAVRARNLPLHAATIAVTTTIPETTIENVSYEYDHDSLGLFQQRASWGTREQRLNPAWATNAFLNKMLQLYPGGTWQNTAVGVVCQRVQVSAYPERYQPEAADGARIAAALWSRRGDSLSGDRHAEVVRKRDGILRASYNNGVNGDLTVRWGDPVQIGTGWNFADGAVYFADLSGDGYAEVIRKTDGDLYAYYNNGINSDLTVRWGDPVRIGNGWNYPDSAVYFADLTGDGYAEAIRKTDGDLYAYYNNGINSDLTVRWSGPVRIGNGWTDADSAVYFADLSGDGYAEVIRKENGNVFAYYNNGINGDLTVRWGEPVQIGTGWNDPDSALYFV